MSLIAQCLVVAGWLAGGRVDSAPAGFQQIQPWGRLRRTLSLWAARGPCNRACVGEVFPLDSCLCAGEAPSSPSSSYTHTHSVSTKHTRTEGTGSWQPEVARRTRSRFAAPFSSPQP